jgi:hypothetical protein
LLINNYISWSSDLDKRWGGLVFITPQQSQDQSQCGGTWEFFYQYVFLGSQGETIYKMQMEKLFSVSQPISQESIKYSSWYEKLSTSYSLEPIIPIKDLFKTR